MPLRRRNAGETTRTEIHLDGFDTVEHQRDGVDPVEQIVTAQERQSRKTTLLEVGATRHLRDRPTLPVDFHLVEAELGNRHP